MKGLAKKVVLVTGGQGLLGTSILKELFDHNVIVINLDISVCDDLILRTIKCDVTSEESIENAILKVMNEYGRIDGLVNNAYPRTSDWGNKFEDIKFSSWQANVDMQMNSCFLFCQKVSEVMKEQKFGSIVNIASIYGVVGADFSVYEGTNMTMPAAYSAIKGGLINFSRYLASYLGKYNIRVNCVSPGGIFDNQPEQFVNNYENIVPMKRMGQPDDIAPSIAFLLSEGAKYITGQNIIIDGGWTSK